MNAPMVVPDTETGDLFGGVSVAPLEAVAAQINAAHADAQAYASKAVERALVAGDLLNTVKAQLRHGEFLPWCKEHCPDIGQRRLQEYMKVARELPAQMRGGAYLSLNEALRLVADPDPEPEPTAGELLPVASAPDPDPADVIAAQQRHIDALEARIDASTRKEFEQKGEVCESHTSTGKDGKERPPVIISNADSALPNPARTDFDQQLESHLKELPRGWGKTKDAIRKTYRTAQKTQAATIRAALEDEYRPMLERERALIQAQRDELIELRKEAQATRDKAAAMLAGITPMMTQEEFRLVRGLLHPDRHPEDQEKYGRALTIFNRLEAGINPNIPIAVLRKSGWGKR